MRFVYPQGRKKALTFSYDDGQKYDRRLVEIFDRYGVKGTFHLNSGSLAKDENSIYVTAAEVKDLYRGHEVAVHGVQHRNLPTLSRQQQVTEVLEDRKALESLTGDLVFGMSYAFGSYSPQIMETLRTLGIHYSRTVNSTGGFFPPADFLAWHPTCHHGDARLTELGEGFLHVADYIELPLMYVWGHSYEFGQSDSWQVIEDFAARMSGRQEIWYATNGEICGYITAVRSLEYSADGYTVWNPTAVSVWARTDDGSLLEIRPGERKKLGEH